MYKSLSLSLSQKLKLSFVPVLLHSPPPLPLIQVVDTQVLWSASLEVYVPPPPCWSGCFGVGGVDSVAAGRWCSLSLSLVGAGVNI